ncbi:hypothetical protein C2G38_2190825 [Gigaspora rosea]|uniref:Uncharacterized protein n=1 Tax=Gigaspora rosea TaxID=44941 RepID=A0A397VA29_9GLOM|nr:hypothetical protein C2G38_2190825 [Gigaspora rosea]
MRSDKLKISINKKILIKSKEIEEYYPFIIMSKAQQDFFDSLRLAPGRIDPESILQIATKSWERSFKKRYLSKAPVRRSTTDNDEVENDYDFSNFELAYRALDPSKMWVLVEQIFSTNPKQVSKIDKNIVNLLKKYNVDNLPTLQKVNVFPMERRRQFYFNFKTRGVVRNEHLAYLVDPAFHKMETDLIMQQVPFDAIEAGRNGEVTKGTKLLADSLKMSKMLKYMINVLATECNMKEDVLRKLQIAGILQEANMMQQTLNLINESKKVDFEHFLNNYYKNDGFQTPPQNIVFLASSTHITPEKKWG